MNTQAYNQAVLMGLHFVEARRVHRHARGTTIR
jgi:hypothetical protein